MSVHTHAHTVAPALVALTHNIFYILYMCIYIKCICIICICVALIRTHVIWHIMHAHTHNYI